MCNYFKKIFSFEETLFKQKEFFPMYKINRQQIPTNENTRISVAMKIFSKSKVSKS